MIVLRLCCCILKGGKELKTHLENNTYATTKEILKYVKETYTITYTLQGMHAWLTRHEFSYKKPKGVWKIANEYVRNNVAFPSFPDFKEKIRTFYDVTWKTILGEVRGRLTDNFQTLKPAV